MDYATTATRRPLREKGVGMDNDLHLTTRADGSYRVESSAFRFESRVLPPQLMGEKVAPRSYGAVETGEGIVGNLDGRILKDCADYDGLELTREFFLSGDNSVLAVRVSMTNRREDSVELAKLCPMEITGPEGLEIGGGGLANWRFFKTCRQKTDVPGSFDFTNQDENFEDAALEGGKIKAGGGVTGTHEDFLNRSEICAEPFFTIKNKHCEERPGICIGIIGQTEHLTTFTIEPDPDFQALKRIRCNCEFDGILIDPGETRRSHWMLVSSFTNESDMAGKFTDITMREMGVGGLAKPPLNVYCTWQFYGFDFCAADLDENLQALKERPLPIDVIQLDNGWMDTLGDYEANLNRFPEGMQAVADRIRAAGFTPGIWTCPTMIEGSSSAARKYPDLIARTREGEPLQFPYIKGDAYAIDPTAPNYRRYMKEVYSKLLAWGFTYHKTDFLRSIILNENIVFHDRKINRAQAYRMAGEVLREVLGEEAYIVSCGGINDAGNAGIYDSLRTTNDMFGFWIPPDGERWKGTLIKVKQGAIRNYVSRFIRTDPDACPIRRRESPFRPGVIRDDLSLGLFNDEEAFSVVLSQYVSGGNICVCENFADLEDDRRALYRHIMPSMAIPARPLDYAAPRSPNLFFAKVVPKAKNLDPWWTLAVGNWFEEEREVEVDLSMCPLPNVVKQLAVFEFHDQEFHGIRDVDTSLTLTMPPHGMRLLRLAPWDGEWPVLLGTDLHFSGGGVEIAAVDMAADKISGRVETTWKEFPVSLRAAFPSGNAVEVVSAVIEPGCSEFVMRERVCSVQQ